MSTPPISTPSWAMSNGDRWVEAAKGFAPLEITDPRYYDEVYENDRPEWRLLAAKSQSGCALTWLRHARRVGVLGCDDLLYRPYEGHTDAVTLVEAVCMRSGALTYHQHLPTNEIFLDRGWMVRIGWTKPKDNVSAWLAEWGGGEHVLTVIDVTGDVVTSIDGGQPGVHEVVRKIGWDRKGRPWLFDRVGHGKRIASVGDPEKIRLKELEPPA